MKVWKIKLKNKSWGENAANVAAPTALQAVDKAIRYCRTYGARFQRRHIIGIEVTSELHA